jgi:hypothetical protein
MNNPYREHPFEVLRLDPAGGNEEVVAQAGRLRQQATSEPEVTALRQAVQALTGPAEDRFLQAMLTHPRPCYLWPDLDRLRTAFRRPPARAEATLSPCPAFDWTEFAVLLQQAAGEPGDPDLLALLGEEVTPEGGEESWETAVARWQDLIEQFPG